MPIVSLGTIAENSAGTPGLWNRVFRIADANFSGVTAALPSPYVSTNSVFPESGNTVSGYSSTLSWNGGLRGTTGFFTSAVTMQSRVTMGNLTAAAGTFTDDVSLTSPATLFGAAVLTSLDVNGLTTSDDLTVFDNLAADGAAIDFTGSTLTLTGATVTGLTAASVGAGTFPGAYTVTGVLTLTAQPILSSLTASQAVFTDGSKGLVSNAITGTGNVVMSASPTLTGTITAAIANFAGNVTMGAGTTLAAQAVTGTTFVATSTFTTDAANGFVVFSGDPANYNLSRSGTTVSVKSAGAVVISGGGGTTLLTVGASNTVTFGTSALSGITTVSVSTAYRNAAGDRELAPGNVNGTGWTSRPVGGNLDGGLALQSTGTAVSQWLEFINSAGTVESQIVNVSGALVNSAAAWDVRRKADGAQQFAVSMTAGADRHITVTGSNGGNPTLNVTGGSFAVTPATVFATNITQSAGTAALQAVTCTTATGTGAVSGFTTVTVSSTITSTTASGNNAFVMESGARFYFDSGVNTFMHESAGDTVALVTGGSERWNTSTTALTIASGVTLAAQAVTATTVTATSNVYAGAATELGWTGRATMKSSADGIIELFNDALSGFTRLNFGGTSSSFPAIKRSSATLAFRLADDSADAAITAAGITASGNGTFQGGSVTIGAASTATAGAIRLTNSAAIVARNAADSANINIIESDGSNFILVDALGQGARFGAGIILSNGATPPSNGIQFGTSAPASLADGQMWYDGTNFKVRTGGATLTITAA